MKVVGIAHMIEGDASLQGHRCLSDVEKANLLKRIFALCQGNLGISLLSCMP